MFCGDYRFFCHITKLKILLKNTNFIDNLVINCINTFSDIQLVV